MNRILRHTMCRVVSACCFAGSVTLAHAAATGSATLQWTAPGDDGQIGRAVAYDLRYGTAPVTASNFSTATRVAGMPAPKTAGAAETFTVTGLVQGTGYYFALKTVDEAQNWSLISNSCYFAVPTTATGGAQVALWLSAPYPNPGRSLVSWSYTLPQSERVDIDAFEITGRRVRSIAHTRLDAGQGGLSWDLRDDQGRAVAPGIYMIHASLGGQTSTQRLVIVR